MATNEEKLSKFNQAIHHYAEEQRRKIEEEVAKFKEKELNEAEDEVLLEAYQLIQKEMAQMRSNITKEMAHREMDKRRELLEKRREIMDKIFAQAADKLREFTKSSEYAGWMDSHCRQLAGVFTAPGTVLYVRPEDTAMKDTLIRSFGTQCQVEGDQEIQLGGIRAQNLTMGLVADMTLDALLENQQEWFEETSGLQVR